MSHQGFAGNADKKFKDADELERFKTDIDLVQYAASRGFEIVRSESSKSCQKLRIGKEEQILVFKDKGGGHYVYKSVYNEDNKGSIIDFVQKMDHCNLGEVRKKLRDFARMPKPEIKGYNGKLQSVEKDILAVQSEYFSTDICNDSKYLNSRGISNNTINNPRFFGTMKVGQYNNILFPHYNEKGLCGFEKKNKNFTGFVEGGEKGLWLSRSRTGKDNTLVVSESAIDALSHYELKPSSYTRYASIGGSMNENQPQLLAKMFKSLPSHMKVVGAFDNDKQGEAFSKQVEGILKENNPALSYERDIPTAKDFNKQLTDSLGITHNNTQQAVAMRKNQESKPRMTQAERQVRR
ncbi:DUF3991 and TOPRIM domain-containing protein [Zooshikella marina]|uniref:toprim domain-containing protein n=1 Tax=Zooshikella ganghwensis TaxID=202772 RepID=UPI001BAEA3A8|nr:toprim domain-containing protein [Zooshikella ganghwensis]MBU2708716.1 DUF3991 and TOPRIM domain-containing protein [Zooshikella ganghwensis]